MDVDSYGFPLILRTRIVARRRRESMTHVRNERGNVAVLAIVLVLLVGLIAARQFWLSSRHARPPQPATGPLPAAPTPRFTDERMQLDLRPPQQPPSLPITDYSATLTDIDRLIKDNKLSEAQTKL